MKLCTTLLKKLTPFFLLRNLTRTFAETLDDFADLLEAQNVLEPDLIQLFLNKLNGRLAKNRNNGRRIPDDALKRAYDTQRNFILINGVQTILNGGNQFTGVFIFIYLYNQMIKASTVLKVTEGCLWGLHNEKPRYQTNI